MQMELHALLKRQLKRLGLEPGAIPADSGWTALLQRVSRAYEEHDQERYLLERSQDLASEEMSTLYAKVRADRDLLEARVAERTEALRLSEARLSSLLSLSADWIWEQDAALRFTYISDGFAAFAGTAPSSLIGQHRESCTGFAADAEALAAYQACVDSRQAFREFQFELLAADGDCRYVRTSGEPVFDQMGLFSGYRGVGRDVTHATLAERKVQEMARFDSLTGLPNRNMFMAEMERALARARRLESTFAVFFIDLDRFKSINDTLGHACGDELLKIMAQRLRQALRETDVVARLGGDEFVILLEGIADTLAVNVAAQKILATIGQAMTIAGVSFELTGSIGIGMYPSDGQDAATLLQHADAAMYLAKDRGKNNIQFYTAELADSAARQFAMEKELRQALLNSEFELHYQPKIDLATGQMVGVEALLRWLHPQRGMVMPGEFIALAEERGLIVPMGRWVIQAACRQLQAWRQAGYVTPAVAVNLSAKQFASDTLIQDVLDSLERYGVAARDFEVELTESVLMEDPARAMQLLQQLNALGVPISIDDFGTGYSSLSYLKRFPAGTVKIDRSFIKGLPSDQDDTAITRAVIAMAHSLGLKVVAEGVETDEQLQLLRGLGCDQVQGYLLGRPMPAADLALRLRVRAELAT